MTSPCQVPRRDRRALAGWPPELAAMLVSMTVARRARWKRGWGLNWLLDAKRPDLAFAAGDGAAVAGERARLARISHAAARAPQGAARTILRVAASTAAITAADAAVATLFLRHPP